MSRHFVAGTLVAIALLAIPASYASPGSLVINPTRSIVTISGVPQDVSTMTITATTGNSFSSTLTTDNFTPFSFTRTSLSGSINIQSNLSLNNPQSNLQSILLANGTQTGPGAFRVTQPTNQVNWEPVGQFSVTQMVPAANANYVPPSTQNTIRPSEGPPQNIMVVPSTKLEIAAERPDFRYQSGRLEFQEQSTHTTGQTGMGIGPGLPQGVTRYVPAGEF